MTDSGIRDRLDRDMKDALRSRDRLRLETIRMARSALRNAEIDRGGSLDEPSVIAVLRSLLKQRQDSIEQFRAGGRTDLAEREEAECRVLEEYLPPLMDDAAIEAVVREVIESRGTSEVQDLGTVMKITMGRLKGRADGKKVNEIVRRLLSA